MILETVAIITLVLTILPALIELGKCLRILIAKFVDHIKKYFLDRKELLRKNKNYLAVSIKDKIAEGKFNVVNCLYDEETEEIVNAADGQAWEAKELDRETLRHFGDQDMLILR